MHFLFQMILVLLLSFAESQQSCSAVNFFKNYWLDSHTSTKPIITYREDAKYPQSEMDEGRHGFVIVSAILISNGTMREVAPFVELSSELDRNAVDASYQIHFRPALKNGSPVSVRSALEFSFQYEYFDEQRLRKGIQFSFPYLSRENVNQLVQTLNPKELGSLATDVEILACEKTGIAELSEAEREEYTVLQNAAKNYFSKKKLDAIDFRIGRIASSDSFIENMLISKGVGSFSKEKTRRFIELQNQVVAAGLQQFKAK